MSNEEIIKLYRTCKNIYDKWLGGTTDVDIFNVVNLELEIIKILN
jgi:hypothetical protein